MCLAFIMMWWLYVIMAFSLINIVPATNKIINQEVEYNVKSIIIGIVHEHLQVCQRVI